MNIYQLIPALKHRAMTNESVTLVQRSIDLFPHQRRILSSDYRSNKHGATSTVLSFIARCFSAGLLAFLLFCTRPLFAQTATPNPTPELAALPGTYAVVRVDADGNTQPGSLKLEADGKFQLRAEWTFEDAKTEGVALLNGDMLAIVDGPVGCRVLLYKFQPAPRSLIGTYTTVGAETPEKQAAFERADILSTPTAPDQQGSTIAGIYAFGNAAKDKGVIYHGQVIVNEQRDYLRFFWTQGTTTYSGIGLVDGQYVGATAAMIPKIVCNLTLFRVYPDGVFEGAALRSDQAAVYTVSAERIKGN